MDEEDTYLLELSVVDDETLRVRFNTKLVSTSTRIYEVSALRHYVNFTNGWATFVKYAGPPYAMYNATSDCTIWLHELKSGMLYYVDPKLKEYRVMGNETNLPTAIVKTERDIYISCLFYNITIDNEVMQCPPFVFTLPKIQSFATTGKAHGVLMVKTDTTAASKPFKFIHKSKEFNDEDFKDQVTLIQNIKQLNQQLSNMKQEKKGIDY